VKEDNGSLIAGAVAGAIAVTAGVAIANFDGFGDVPACAEVVSVDPVTQTVRTPREDCNPETVTQQKPVKDEKRIAGSVIGAVVGGVAGNQIGSGTGKDIATAAGAVAGGVAGNKIQKEIQEHNTEQVVETRCHTVYDSSQKTVAYDVKYRLGDKVTRSTRSAGITGRANAFPSTSSSPERACRDQLSVRRSQAGERQRHHIERPSNAM
jgi:uncharacterized protein YcfJ